MLLESRLKNRLLSKECESYRNTVESEYFTLNQVCLLKYCQYLTEVQPFSVASIPNNDHPEAGQKKIPVRAAWNYTLASD